MKGFIKLFLVFLMVFLGSGHANAAVVGVSVDGTITNTFGSIPGISIGSGFDATFTYDTNSANADLSDFDPTIGQIDIFSGFPYGSSASVGSNFYSAGNTTTIISDNIFFAEDEIDVTIPAGTYDMFAIATFADDFNWVTETGLAWGVFFVGNTNLFSGSSISGFSDPLSMLNNPDLITAVFSVGQISGGLDVSEYWGEINNPSPVPVPAAVWLFGSGLLGLLGFIKRKQ